MLSLPRHIYNEIPNPTSKKLIINNSLLLSFQPSYAVYFMFQVKNRMSAPTARSASPTRAPTVPT